MKDFMGEVDSLCIHSDISLNYWMYCGHTFYVSALWFGAVFVAWRDLNKISCNVLICRTNRNVIDITRVASVQIEQVNQ